MLHDKRIQVEQLQSLGDRLRGQGKTIVWTNGCFDLFHLGHLRSLQAARNLGDVLVVGLNSDESVRGLKGPNRPIFSEAERAEMLAALECVDFVVIFPDATPERMLSELRPAIHCKGADYGPEGGKPIPEKQLVESYGGKVVFIPLLPALSTSGLIARLRE